MNLTGTDGGGIKIMNRKMKLLLIIMIIVMSFIYFPGFILAEIKQIGDTIEVEGVLEWAYGKGFVQIKTTCIDVEPPGHLNVNSSSFNLCSKYDKLSYLIGYKEEVHIFDDDDKELKAWTEKFRISELVGKKVKMLARINLCDECHRQCVMCNVCCNFYLEPLKIEVLSSE